RQGCRGPSEQGCVKRLCDRAMPSASAPAQHQHRTITNTIIHNKKASFASLFCLVIRLSIKCLFSALCLRFLYPSLHA
ncbi:hypothetical protein, partial [Pantoea septica]|uniref:hypothetical protein n=1 Tax=Pantoea septica TaxID=472695 RepID=UPI0028B1205C